MKDPQSTCALVTPSFEGGGVERVMLNLANGLAAQGVPVDLVAISAHGPYRSQTVAGVRVVNLAASRMVWAIPALVRYLRRAQPAAVLTALDYINVATILANHLAGTPAQVYVSTHKHFSTATRASSLWRERFLLPAAMRVAYRAADGVVAISKAMADDLSKAIDFPRSRIRVIANPAVTGDLLALAHAAPSHPWLRDKNIPTFLGVGRLHEQKDFSTLIGAFARVRERRPSRLVIFGEGPQRSALEELARELGVKKDVDLPGFTTNPYAEMRAASTFVLSSRYEGLPTVLIEAMACGCPIVSTDCPSGPAEILEGGKHGPLVPVGDAEALSAAMLHCLEFPKSAEQLTGRAGDFHQDKVVQEYRSLLRV
jgi:glycosyltransferase involved in cell wall biosynthesis